MTIGETINKLANIPLPNRYFIDYNHSVLDKLKATNFESRLEYYQHLAVEQGITQSNYYRHIFQWLHDTVEFMFSVEVDEDIAVNDIQIVFEDVAELFCGTKES